MILPGIIIVLIGACLFCLLRAALGPTAPDRMVAIDTLACIIAVCLVLLGVFYRTSFYLDVALVYAFLLFLGTVAISKYLEGRGLES
jgi:multicomponent Na+:H+ antiporter subunit F